MDWNIKKHIVKPDIPEGIFKGILVGDSELEKYEKETESTEKRETESKAIVYAGIKVNNKEEEILCLPPDHTVFPKVDIEELILTWRNV